MSLIALDLRGLPKDRNSLPVRYANGLGIEIATRHDLLLVYKQPYQLDLVPKLARAHRSIRFTSRIGFLNNRQLNREGVQLVYCPTPSVKRLGGRFRTITTDLVELDSTSRQSKTRRSRSDRVIAGSIARSKFLAEYNLARAQPTVIHPGTDLISGDTQAIDNSLGARLLYGGAWLIDGRVQYLARAMSVLGDFELLITPKLTDAQRRKIQDIFDASQARVRFAQDTTPAVLKSQIQHAFAVIQTEIPDAHGLIPPDIMALGVPCIQLDDSLMQEIGGATGIYFSKHDPLSLVSKVRSLQHIGSWKRASEAALRRSSQLSWTQLAQKLHRLIEQLTS